MKLIVRAQLREPRGSLMVNHQTMPCALGPSGMVTDKKEGDGGTPIAKMKLLYGFYRPDRVEKPKSILPFKALSPDMGWCDDPAHEKYNQLVRLPFSASHEKMWREDHLYDLCVVLDWNISPAVPGNGSAIFFHLAHNDYRPTEGCIALSKPDMDRVLSLIDAETIMDTAIT